MADKKNDNTEAKVFDVAEPEEAKLNIGAKPMVIGHKPSSDPTIAVKDTATEEKAEAAEESSTPSKKIRIEPLSETVSEEKEDSVTEEKTTEPASSSTTEENTPSQTDESATKEDTPKVEVSAETIDDTKERDFAAEAENQEQSAQDAESAREEKVEELVKSKKYHVTIKEKKDSAFGKVLAVLFAILVSIVGVYVLADADIIPGGELLPARFIGTDENVNEVETQEVNQSNGVENQTISIGEVDVPAMEFTSTLINDESRKFVLEDPYVTFVYPASFGGVSQSQTESEGRTTFSFDDNSNYVFSINKTNRSGPSGHDSPTLNLQSYITNENGDTDIFYVTPDSKTKEPIDTATVLVTGENYIIFETSGIASVFAGISLLTNSDMYESIVFDYTTGAGEDTFTAEDAEVEQLKAILDTLAFSAE